jgi:hypothetical protein
VLSPRELALTNGSNGAGSTGKTLTGGAPAAEPAPEPRPEGGQDRPES